MKVLVKIPAPLRQYTSNQKEIEVTTSSNTVKDVIIELTNHYPELKTRLLDETGSLRKFLTIFLNNSNLRDIGGETAQVKDGDIITILPAIAGGKTK